MSSGIGAGVLVALIGLSACSGESAAPDVTVVAAATSTTFRTEPVRTTSTTVAPPPDDEEANPGTAQEVNSEEPAGEQTYEVRGGDYLVGIARQFGVTAEAIAAYNGWDDVQHPINPGESIRIPPEDWTPDDPAAGSEPPDPASTDAAGDGTCSDESEQQTYTIRAGDVKGAVARRFDVTVAELDAANAATPFYAGFVIGIEILIPC